MSQMRRSVAISMAGWLVAAAAATLSAAGQQALPPPVAEARPPARRPFQPPADGRLTENQVKMYIAVRRLAPTLSRPDESANDPLAQITRLVASLNNETAAVSQVGADLDEYRWVGAQVAESGMGPASAAPAVGDELLKAIAAAASKAREAAGSTGSDAPRPAAEASGTAAEALAYNRQLLSKFKAELDALKPR